MVDTLEPAKKLEGAGFERRQAEAVASAVAGGATERDKQLDELKDAVQGVRDELKASVQGVRDELKASVQGVRDELRDAVQGVRTEIQSVRTELARLETAIAKSRTEQIMWTVGALGVLAALLRLLP